MEFVDGVLQKETTGMGTHYYVICPVCEAYNLLRTKTVGDWIVCRKCSSPIKLVEEGSE
jgi:hypothetical protein